MLMMILVKGVNLVKVLNYMILFFLCGKILMLYGANLSENIIRQAQPQAPQKDMKRRKGRGSKILSFSRADKKNDSLTINFFSIVEDGVNSVIASF